MQISKMSASYRRFGGGAVLALAFSLALAGGGCSSNSTDSAPPATTTSTTTVVHSDIPTSATGTATSAEMPAPISTTSLPARMDSTNAGPGGATGTQQQIADQINQAIIRNTQMTGSRVTAVVDDAGAATLTGFVQNQQQKALASKAAQDTPGVTIVRDKLEIRPTGGVGHTSPGATPAPVPQVQSFPDGGGAVGGSSGSSDRMARRPAPTPTPPSGVGLLPHRPDNGDDTGTSRGNSGGDGTGGTDTTSGPSNDSGGDQ